VRLDFSERDAEQAALARFPLARFPLLILTTESQHNVYNFGLCLASWFITSDKVLEYLPSQATKVSNASAQRCVRALSEQSL